MLDIYVIKWRTTTGRMRQTPKLFIKTREFLLQCFKGLEIFLSVSDGTNSVVLKPPVPDILNANKKNQMGGFLWVEI